MTTKEILQKARDLIADPKRWTTGELKRTSELGTSFCAIGAVNEVLGLAQNEKYVKPGNHEALKALASAIWPPNTAWDKDDWSGAAVYHHNDTMGHECTLQMFDAAIEKLSA